MTENAIAKEIVDAAYRIRARVCWNSFIKAS